MLSSRFALPALAVACVLAAGGGGYLATRHNSSQNVEAFRSPESDAASTSAVSTTAPVQETEAVVGDAAKPSPAAAAPVSIPVPQVAKRVEPPVRPAPRVQAAAKSSTSHDAQSPALDRTWPNGAASGTPPGGGSNAGLNGGPNDPTGPARDEHPVVEAPQVIEPPPPTYEELVVSADSVIGLQTDRTLSSERARVEDTVEARVARDVRVDGKVAIPAGTHAVGSVIVVDRGGKFKEQARLGIRFHTLVMADGTHLPITTETVYRYGAPPGNGSAAKIGGGAVAGAILGAILGGGKGAAVGAATGAGAGTAVAASGDRNEATFPAGAEVTARILSPVTVTLEK